MSLVIVPLLVGAVSLLSAFTLSVSFRKGRVRSPKMAEVAGFISVGAKAYLLRQLKTIVLVAPLLAFVLYLLLDFRIALIFLLGVVSSLSTALVGMSTVVRANLKTADCALDSPWKAFQSALAGGSVMGFSVTGLSLLMLSILYILFKDPALLVGFGVGSSLAALFAQIGGGIYTKAADIGADLVGKVEKHIPEDDPRNPAVIADLVGDNVGDCAGRGADLFQTFSDDIVTGMLVSATFIGKFGPKVLLFPVLLQSVGIISSLLGILFIRKSRKMEPEVAFSRGMILVAALAVLGAFVVVKFLLGDLGIFLASVMGILLTVVVSFITKHYVGGGGGPVKNIAKAAERGAALNVIAGLAIGLQSPFIPIVMIAAAVCAAFAMTSVPLLAVVAVNIGTDLLIGYIMAADAYGPIVDNASGIAEMSQVKENVVRSLSRLDLVGNTMKAVTKSYAMCSGTVTAFVMFSTFFMVVGTKALDVTTPFSPAFVLLGVALPYLISSLVIGATSRTALRVVDEVRRQFREIRGILKGRAVPDYTTCVDIVTRNALREMVVPGLLCAAVPVLVGFLFGAWALGSLLVGIVTSAALLGPFFNTTGTALDNAKKLIEGRGEKGSFAHQAAVIGDVVGDPLKDVAGPSLLIFMKLAGMLSLLIASAI